MACATVKKAEMTAPCAKALSSKQAKKSERKRRIGPFGIEEYNVSTSSHVSSISCGVLLVRNLHNHAFFYFYFFIIRLLGAEECGPKRQTDTYWWNKWVAKVLTRGSLSDNQNHSQLWELSGKSASLLPGSWDVNWARNHKINKPAPVPIYQK